MAPKVAALLLAAAGAAAAFRPPAVPLAVKSPYFSIWSPYQNLYDGWTEHWSGPVAAFCGFLRVDGVAYLFMGGDGTAQGRVANQQGDANVTATQSLYTFSVGGVSLRVTFTSPSIPTDLDLLSSPTTYLTFDVASTDGGTHNASVYFDFTAEIITRNTSQVVTWSRPSVPAADGSGRPLTALKLGSLVQNPLFDGGGDDRISWGYAYLLADPLQPGLSSSLADSATSRTQFVASGTLPDADAQPPAPVDQWVSAAAVWDFGRISPSTPAASLTRTLTVFYDEILVMSFFGSSLPPYWRRNYPVNSWQVTPAKEMAAAVASYPAVRTACAGEDQRVAAVMSAAAGASQSTLTQLTYRQVLGACSLAWDPSRNAPLYFLKEISSDGDVQTMDVVFPAAPQFLYTAPNLLQLMMIPLLDYAANYTNVPYNLPWTPHHLGHWPISDLPPSQQENMPIEETGNLFIMLAAIAQRMNGDVAWLQPYLAVLNDYGQYLQSGVLPYPGLQLCTDDFEGPSPNNTNLAAKGTIGLAAYGYLASLWGDNAAAEAAWTNAASYAATFVTAAWVGDHFAIQYGSPSSTWSQKYNLAPALWLGMLDLFPNVTQWLPQELAYYTGQLNTYGVPLDDRYPYTKGDWSSWVASLAYDSATGEPSALSNAIFDTTLAWANDTLSNWPLSDWYQTTLPLAQGFRARPVYGAFFASALVSPATADAVPGLRSLAGHEWAMPARLAADPVLARAHEVFRRVHASRGF